MQPSTFHNHFNRIIPGKKDWKSYEVFIAVLLKVLFFPSLIDRPILQSRSQIPPYKRDIIIPSKSLAGVWHSWSWQYGGDLFVVECKNYKNPISSKEVESTAKYLRRPALANLGLIFTRLDPSDTAYAAAKDIFETDGRLLIFLIDGDVRNLIDSLGEQEKSEEVIRSIYVRNKLKMS